MKIGIIGESFLPRVNGVSNSIDRIALYLANNGHQVTVITAGRTNILYNKPYEIIRLNSVELPIVHDYDFPLVSLKTIEKILKNANFDLIHAASPFVLGYLALKVSKKLSIPSIAVYQTDVSGFSKFYGFGRLSGITDLWTKKIHKLADLNLVPSKWAWNKLFELGVRNLEIWGRGVDTDSFQPIHRDVGLRKSWNPNAKLFIGYVGRLAPEKNIENLSLVNEKDEMQIVVVGDGPSRKNLEKKFPKAVFTGRLSGKELSKAYASLDVLFATGENETFCQVAQEALASGLFVFAPSKGATQELIKHGINGYVYDSTQKFEINKLLNTFRHYPEYLESISITNRLLVSKNSWDATCNKLLQYYVYLLNINKKLSLVS